MTHPDIDVAALEAPWPEHLEKTHPYGRDGPVTYVEAAEYVRRLNRVFGGRWSFEIKDWKVGDSEVMVCGALSAAGETKHSFGGAAIKHHKSTGEILSIADDLKAAATDALKKASTLFGVGLEHHSKGSPKPQGRRGQESPRSSRRSQDERVDAIKAATEASGRDWGKVCQWIDGKFSKPVAALSDEEVDQVLRALAKGSS